MTFLFDRRFAFTVISLGLLCSISTCQETAGQETAGQETAGQAADVTEESRSVNPLPLAAETNSVDFQRDIQPILRNHCYECHAGTTEEGGLNLGVKNIALRGGESGEAIMPGHSKQSLLIQLVSGLEEDRLMPPAGNQPLSDPQIKLLQAWIDQGAEWPDGVDVADPKLERAKTHWAFQRLSPMETPPRHDEDHWSKGPIDRYVLRRLDDVGLRPAQPADASTLVRRLYFDLIGLPPTPTQTNAFILAHAENPDLAIQQLVDQLLASPRYGERWARHWLDVARYADSDGQEADQDRPHAYTYRDFVIQAFNDNLPFDQFVRWQIAGDEFEPDNDAAIAATGFLTAGPAFKLPDSFRRSDFYDREIEVDIGFPAMLSDGAEAADFWQQAKAAYGKAYGEIGKAKSTLQRRALAEWIADTEQGGGALLARVIVNRLWGQVFQRLEHGSPTAWVAKTKICPAML